MHRYRLIKAGKFPKPINIGGNTNVWVGAETDEYLKACIAKRDAQRRTQSAA